MEVDRDDTDLLATLGNNFFGSCCGFSRLGL